MRVHTLALSCVRMRTHSWVCFLSFYAHVYYYPSLAQATSLAERGPVASTTRIEMDMLMNDASFRVGKW